MTRIIPMYKSPVFAVTKDLTSSSREEMLIDSWAIAVPHDREVLAAGICSSWSLHLQS